ncbi:MAG: hypothetical protein IPJ43_16690 [Saprospiraceae bacterium]|nr:hypothetical protein [Saprospiraceae bacterium]
MASATEAHARLLEIDAGQSAIATLGRFDEGIEHAIGEEADMCGLHRVEKVDRHVLELDQHDRVSRANARSAVP